MRAILNLDISNLSEGLEVKNFKELCSLVNSPVLEGNSKKAFLADLKRYVGYSTKGHKYFIEKVYEFPAMKPARADSVWIDNVGLCLLHKLSEHINPEEDYTAIFAEKSKLILYAGLCKEYFYIYRYKSDEHSDNEKSFFNDTSNKFSKILEKVLNNLSVKKTIYYKKGYEFNKVGSKDRIIASDKESSEIIECYLDSLKKVGCSDIIHVYKSNRQVPYWATATELLKKQGYYGVREGIVFTVGKSIYKSIEHLTKIIALNAYKELNNEAIKGYLFTRAAFESDNIENSIFRDGRIVPIEELKEELKETYKRLIVDCIDLSIEGLSDEDIYQEILEVEDVADKVFGKVEI